MNEKLTRKVILELLGNTNGLKLRLLGQMGVRTIALSEGWTIGPPALREYAVDPVGVETISPSPTDSVRCCPSTNVSIVLRCGSRPRCKAISFMTCHSTHRSPCPGHRTVTMTENETFESS